MNRHDLEDRLDAMGVARAARFLKKLGAERLDLPINVWVVSVQRGNDLVVEERDGCFYVNEAEQWVEDADLDLLFPDAEQQFHDDFWRRPSPLYHATTKERSRAVDLEGLIPRDLTRGIANRNTGAAIFTTTDLEEATYGSYGDVVYTIDTEAMKRAGYTPRVAEEGPIREYELKMALAHMMGVEMEFDVESGLSMSTVVLFDPIPRRFLSR